MSEEMHTDVNSWSGRQGSGLSIYNQKGPPKRLDSQLWTCCVCGKRMTKSLLGQARGPLHSFVNFNTGLLSLTASCCHPISGPQQFAGLVLSEQSDGLSNMWDKIYLLGCLETANNEVICSWKGDVFCCFLTRHYLFFLVHFEITCFISSTFKAVVSSLHHTGNSFTGLTARIPKAQNKAKQTQGIKSSLHFPKCQLKNIPQQRLKLLSQLKTEKLFRSKIPGCFQRAQYWNSSKLKMCPVIRQPPWCGSPSAAVRMEAS